ncbi:MAG TPA: sigma-70 family RNA polymerase sigma factor [Clostridia bacterium]|nr:sigma-70 family RNA polymerase sigma factor [Clostridia bacterium]
MEQKTYLSGREIERIVETYSDMLLRIAINRVRNKTEAEDIVQAVFLRLMTRQPKFQSPEHERAWLIRTAINLCLDYDKSASRRANVPLNDDIAAALPEENAGVLEAVWKLPERDRYIIYLYYFEELAIKEIASLLDERTGTITSRLSRARNKLKLLLKGDGYGTVSKHV